MDLVMTGLWAHDLQSSPSYKCIIPSVSENLLLRFETNNLRLGTGEVNRFRACNIGRVSHQPGKRHSQDVL